MTISPRSNPYLGPVPFQRTDRHLFFGRESEARSLLDKVIAETIVIFCAKSGAGKSSLVNARLIPALLEQRFKVYPPVRFSSELPTGILPKDVANIFVFKTICYLNEEQNREAQSLRNESLPSFLAAEPVEQEEFQPRVLIVDQFEEILTTHPDRSRREREDFFHQLQQALDVGALSSVLFVMREDYLAPLEYYKPILEDRLGSLFHMDALSYRDAVAAIRQPAEKAGRPFDGEVAEILADNLRKSDQGKEGKTSFEEVIEPVQLQVVCRQLWEKLEGRPGETITRKDLEECGDVDTALVNFYEDMIAKVSKTSNVGREQLLPWFYKKLITPPPNQVRKQVNRGTLETEGLPNSAITKLDEVHLIRRLEERGGIWYELAHDTFIKPVVEVYEKWLEEHHSPVIDDAKAWHEAGRDSSFLYQGRRLQKAVVWAKANEKLLSEVEIEFLDSCNEAESVRTKRRARRWRVAGILLLLGLIFTGWLAVEAFQKRKLAEENEQRAIANEQRAIVAEKDADEKRQEAEAEKEKTIRAKGRVDSLLTVANDERTRAEKSERKAEAEKQKAIMAQNEYDRLWRLAIARILAVQGPRQQRKSTYADAEANKRANELAARLGQHAYLFNTQYQGAPPATAEIYNGLREVLSASYFDTLGGPFTSSVNWMNCLAVSADGRFLAGGSDGGMVVQWRLDNGRIVDQKILENHRAAVRGVAFHPKRNWLASVSDDTMSSALKLWKIDDDEKPLLTSKDYNARVLSLAFSPEGKTLATGDASGRITLWQVHDNDMAALEPARSISTAAMVRAVAFSRDSRFLVSGHSDGKIRLWDVRSSHDEPFATLIEHSRPIKALAFSSNGEKLASGGEDKRICLWDWSGETPTLDIVLVDHKGDVNTLAFSPNSSDSLLASGGSEGYVYLWHLNHLKDGPYIELEHERTWVLSTVFSADGKRLLSATQDQKIRSWYTNSKDLADSVSVRFPGPLDKDDWEKFIGPKIDPETIFPKTSTTNSKSRTSNARPGKSSSP